MVNYSKIDTLSDQKDISKSRLSVLSGKSRGYLKDCKRLNLNIPDDILFKIAVLLDTTPEYLRDETDEPSRTPDTLDLSKLDPAVAALIKKIVASPLDKVKAINKLLDTIHTKILHHLMQIKIISLQLVLVPINGAIIKHMLHTLFPQPAIVN